MLEEKKKQEEKERGDKSIINRKILAEVSNKPGDEKRWVQFTHCYTAVKNMYMDRLYHLKHLQNHFVWMCHDW